MENYEDPPAEKKDPGSTLKNLLRHANITFDETSDNVTIDSDSEIQFDVSKVLELLLAWGIKSSSYIVTLDQLSHTPMPHIGFIQDKVNNKEWQWPVLITAISAEKVSYIHPVIGAVVEEISYFSQRWNNVVITFS